jgi:hypothetical protein
VRHYSDTVERCIRTRARVSDWADDGLIEPSQAGKLEAELQVDVVRTNPFLRVTIAVFTLIIVGATTAFIASLLALRSEESFAALTAIAAIVCIVLAEALVGRFRLYRFGVEEMLAGMAVVLLSISVTLFLMPSAGGSESFFALGLAVAAAGAFAVYRRFGFVWAAIGSMCAATTIPFPLSRLSNQTKLMTAAAILGVVFAVARSKRLRDGEEWPGDEYGILQAAAFAGVYLILNVRLMWNAGPFTTPSIDRWFYWTTWVVTWVLPVSGLVLSIRDKDRPLLIVSLAMAVGTLITNKLYLGWARHSWDPMLLGILLMSVALALRRWLASGQDGARHGFTVAPIRRSKDSLLTVLSAAPIPVGTHEAPAPAQSGFEGGRSGGGGAGGSF